MGIGIGHHAATRPQPNSVAALVTTLRSPASGLGDSDLLRATFPPGSVTGAPKIRAMRVIAELEASGREAYTGAIGFASPLAGLELNVVIRTLELSGDRIWLGAGGGVVADSDPTQSSRSAWSRPARWWPPRVASWPRSHSPPPPPHRRSRLGTAPRGLTPSAA